MPRKPATHVAACRAAGRTDGRSIHGLTNDHGTATSRRVLNWEGRRRRQKRSFCSWPASSRTRRRELG
ncbi:MAG: hypothetical protein JWO62_2028 [Acidimicrobiaceae bacterium]|nr:hypothetical protein [Acidimicrobiaceae bacterium]